MISTFIKKIRNPFSQRKRVFGVLLFLTTCCFVLQPIYAEEGEYAAEFLSAGVGARAIGMGGAFVSVANDATAAYWNPAGLAKIGRNAFSAMYSDVFESADGGFLSSGLVKYNFANYIHNWRTVGTFGVSWIRLGIDDIPRTTFTDVNYNNKLGDFYDTNGNGVKDPGELYIDRPKVAEFFSNSDDAILISYARPFSEWLAVGSNFKILHQSLFRNRAFGWGFDVGAIFKVVDGFQIGVIIQDATGTRISWNTDSRPTFVRSPNLKFGASYLLPISVIKSTAIFSADIDTDGGDIDSQNNSQFRYRIHYGVEYWLFNIIALRAGMEKKGHESLGELSVGAGFRIPIGNAAIYADYAFASHEDLGGSQRISLSGQF
jgi:hypothetical protein